MGLLDRFRAQPRWKNSSPAIRQAGVEELPLDQQDILVSIAREDRDPGVRVAALKKVLAPSAIADIARSDADERVREQATALLVDLACGEFEGTDQSECLAALAGLSDPKNLLHVARSAGAEAVARAAMGRLQEPGAFGSVARRSPHSAVRLEALSRIEDEAELAAVAVRGDFKDSTAAAVERLTSRERLDEVAGRAKNKTAAKRARARLREIDEAVEAAARAARADAVPVPTPDELALAQRRRKASALCQHLEALVNTSLDEGDAALGEAERGWQALALPDDDELTVRFAAAAGAVRTALESNLADRAERARLAQVTAEAVAARRSLCETLDAVAGEEAPARLAEARAAWSVLAACPDEVEASRWARRFEDSFRAAEARHRAALAQRARREKAARVCADLERLAASAEFPRARGDWQALRRAWSELTSSGLDDQALGVRFKEADERLQAREGEAREQRAREQQDNLARLQKLCAEVEAAAAAPDLTLKAGERLLRDARAALDAAPPLPARQDREQLEARLEPAMSALFPRVQELRDMDDWQRWANAGVQEELCQRVEKLVEVEDLAVAARQLREAQARWKEVATAPRGQSQDLWTRFKAASDAVRARCDVYFAQMAAEQTGNQARKEALCQRAEALSNSSDWIKTAEAIKALQAEWKTVGPAPRAQEKALWDRFHGACDAFFTRRREDLQHRKEEWAGNLARKEAICVQAEAIAETTEWQKGVEDIKRLQAEWKTVGPVRKARADAVWQRFRAACDRFFERYQHRDQVAAAVVVSDAEAVLQEFESLGPAEGELPLPPADLAPKAAALRARWIAVAASLPRERALRLADRYTRAVTRLVDAWPASFAGTDWDPEVNLRKMEELCVQVEQLLGPEGGSGHAEGAPTLEEESPATLLARQLRDALATNTIAGRPDDGPRWKAAAEDLRSAQAAWKRIGPVPEGASRSLNARFQKACARAAEKIEQRKRGMAAH
jgi:hypothetical protein